MAAAGFAGCVGVLLLTCAVSNAATPFDGPGPETPAQVKPPPPRPPEERERSVTLMIRPRRERAYAVRLAASVLGITGNREIFSLESSLSASVRIAPDWVWSTEARAFYDRRFGNLTADVLEGAQRLDWLWTDKSSAFVELSASHLPFQGLELLAFATLGATHSFLYRLDERGRLTDGFGGEVGLTGFREEYVLSPRAPPGAVLTRSGRSGIGPSVSLWYERGFESSATLGAEVELVLDVVEASNVRVTTSAYAGARIVGPLTLSVFVTYAYDGQTPVAIDAHDFYVVTQLSLQLEELDPLPGD